MFSRCLKRSLCVVLSCTVLVFSCVFMPRQRAEASFVLPVVGTVAGLFALGLLAYGVSTSADSDFVQDNLSSFSDAIGFLSDPLSEVRTKVCASLVLSAALPFAELAYSSGACSTIIQGPSNIKPCFSYYSIPDTSSYTFSLSSSRQDFFLDDDFSGSLDTGLSLYCPYSSGGYLTFFLFEGRPYYFSTFCSHSASDLSYFQVFLNPSYNRFYFPDSGYVSVFSYNGTNYFYGPISKSTDDDSSILNGLTSLGYSFTSSISPSDIISKFCSSDLTFNDVSGGISADVSVKPCIPGACDVFNSSKSLDSYHIDSPGNDVLDLGNLLDKTGCESIDDVVTKVYTGDLTASDVIGGLDCRPYVDVDADTGTIAIPNETTNSRPIALDQDLSIPSDIADTDTYEPINPPLDDTNTDRTNRPSGSYTFPLSNFFPFCLPWDIYKVLSIFNTSPKAPVISIPLGSFFSDIPGVDKDSTDYICTIDLGDENFKKWFQILRLLESIGIIVGFVLISRYLIHGGD